MGCVKDLKFMFTPRADLDPRLIAGLWLDTDSTSGNFMGQ